MMPQFYFSILEVTKTQPVMKAEEPAKTMAEQEAEPRKMAAGTGTGGSALCVLV